MDAVIPYVNSDDPLWQADYERFAGEPFLAKRFRDWGTLQYLFRGIEKNMPFIDRVFLVVARESQVPEWLDTSKVRVICHRDFIPRKYLPAFSSSLIEMFIHTIPGLGEKFIYMNDDIFPVRKIREEDLFPGGKPAKKMSSHIFAFGDFRHLCKDSCTLARRAAGLWPSPIYVRPQHCVTPFLKSACEEAYNACEKEILSTLSPLRKRGNFNQYFFSDYMYFKGLAVSRRISNKHFSLAVAGNSEIVSFLKAPARDFVCINDVRMSEDRYNETRQCILEAFEGLLGTRSGFELCGALD